MHKYKLQEAKRQNRERFQDISKRRLMKNIQRKFQATMIGALAQFEKEFGHLWGHGKDAGDITQDEQEWLDVWDEVRNEILNNGNHQLRAAQEEIDEYTMTWDKYHYDFVVKKTY